MNFGKVAALTVLLVGSLALDTVATAQELFGVHVIAVNRFHSPSRSRSSFSAKATIPYADRKS